jgi:hypothetical protein
LFRDLCSAGNTLIGASGLLGVVSEYAIDSVKRTEKLAVIESSCDAPWDEGVEYGRTCILISVFGSAYTVGTTSNNSKKIHKFLLILPI